MGVRSSIKEVYDKYKTYGRSAIYVDDETQPIDKEKTFKLSVSSRFRKNLLHQRILDVLEETLAEFRHLGAYEIVELLTSQVLHGIEFIDDYYLTESVTYVVK